MNQKKFLAGFLGATMIFTQNPSIALDNSASSHPTVNKNHSGEGLSTAVKIALGVGIPTVAIAAIIGGAFIYLHNKDQRIEPLGDNDVQLDDNSSDQNVPVIASSQPGSSNTVPQVSVVPPQTNQPTSAQPPVVLPSGTGKIPQALHASEVSQIPKTPLTRPRHRELPDDPSKSPAPQSLSGTNPPPTLGLPAKVVPTSGSPATVVPTPVPAPASGSGDGGSSGRKVKPLKQPAHVDEPEKSTIGDAMAEYRRKNPRKATKLEDFSVYRGTTGDGTPLGNFLNALFWGQRLAHPSKKEQTSGHIIGAQPLDNFRNGLLNVDGQEQGSKGPKTSKLEGLNNTNGISELNQRIFVQVGKTPQENISYLELHRLLWEDVQGLPDLHDFWGKHKDHIDKRFMDLLHKYGYNPETAPVASSVPGSVDVPPPYVPPTSAPAVDPKHPLRGVDTRSYTYISEELGLDVIDQKTIFKTKENLQGGNDVDYGRATMPDTGESANDMTGHGHGIANIFAFVSDEIREIVLKNRPEERKREVIITEKELPLGDSGTPLQTQDNVVYLDVANMYDAFKYASKNFGCDTFFATCAPNQHTPGGSNPGALTGEETVDGQCMAFPIKNSRFFKSYYTKPGAQYNPLKMGIIKYVTFFSSGHLNNGYMLRQGLNPSLLNKQPEEIMANSIKATMLVAAAPNKEELPKGQNMDEPSFEKFVKQHFAAIRAMVPKEERSKVCLVFMKAGAGAFSTVPSSYYEKNGKFEQLVKKYAQDIHVIVMNTPPEQYTLGLSNAHKYLDELKAEIETGKGDWSEKLTPERKQALLNTIERARRDVTLDADPLKKAMSDAVRKGSIPEKVEFTSDNYTIDINTEAITQHVDVGSKNIAACYYGKTAIHNFIEDAVNSENTILGCQGARLSDKVADAYKKGIMSTVLWRNSNNTIWYNSKGKGYFCFSEPTYTGMWPKDDCVLKRFVEFNGKMYEASLVYFENDQRPYAGLYDARGSRFATVLPLEDNKFGVKFDSSSKGWQDYYYYDKLELPMRKGITATFHRYMDELPPVADQGTPPTNDFDF